MQQFYDSQESFELQMVNIPFFYMTCRVNFFIPFLAFSGHETCNMKNPHFQKRGGKRKPVLNPQKGVSGTHSFKLWVW